MLICSWNLNNRVGRVPFRPEAAKAAAATQTDLLVLNEFYPQERLQQFQDDLRAAGYEHQVLSLDTGAKANRVLIAGKAPLKRLELELPSFDDQFAANVAAVECNGLKVVGVRVPAYTGASLPMLDKAWEWLVKTASELVRDAAVITGDLNASVRNAGVWTRPKMMQILASGWTRANPGGPSYFGSNGYESEIDHLLATRRCRVDRAELLTLAGGYVLTQGQSALSDHAALACRVTVLDP